ncbi:MAG: tRNA(Ile)-lysidine synthetase, partial [Anaerolineae bacterium]|nr:tRNA(Ile)-lysidine synthetase [Anaerolineae bacterium]
MDLIQTVIHTLNRFSALPCLVSQRVMVAVSGGADSLCLLHLLHRLQPELGMTLAVATLDHGLRGEAGAADAAFVAALARDWGLPTWH